MKEIRTKEELKKAVESKTNEFVVVGNLVKDLKKVQVMKKVSTGALVALGASLAAAPLTGGLSLAPAVVALSAETGIAVGIIALFVGLGVSIMISTFNDYETEFSMDEKKVTYRRKKEK